jgi:hypothetical protein
VRPQLVAELAVVVDVEARGVGQAERGRGAGIEPPPPGLVRKVRSKPLEAWLPSRSRKLGTEVERGVAHRLLVVHRDRREGSIARAAVDGVITACCGSAATGRKLCWRASYWVLNFARCLLAGGFHVAISGTIGFGRSTVRFATLRLKTRTDFRKPVCGVARAKAWPRLFYV